MASLLICGLLSICLSCVMSAPITNDGPKVIDMSYPYEKETIVWPSVKHYSHKVAHWGPYPDENGTVPFVAFFNIETGEHVGTHMDAPIHFYKTGQTIDQVPLERTIGEAVVIDITSKAEQNPDYELNVSDLEEWEKKHGRMPENPIVFLYTGYGKFWPDAEKYLGSKTPMDPATFHFPGLSAEAATWLAAKRNLKMYGVDTISLDAANESISTFPVHMILGSHNISGIENVANLHLLPSRGAEVFAAPMKTKHGSGGPTRLFARIGTKKDVSGGTALNSGIITIIVAMITLYIF